MCFFNCHVLIASYFYIEGILYFIRKVNFLEDRGGCTNIYLTNSERFSRKYNLGRLSVWYHASFPYDANHRHILDDNER